MAWYTAELGSYVFDVTPAVSFECVDVTRRNVAPAVLVARLYTFTLRGRTRADTPALVATGFLSFLSGVVNVRTTVAHLKIKDAGGTALAQFGNVIEGTSENWEDLAVERVAFDHADKQLVAGAEFLITFTARKSFPDANGICEFDQERSITPDEFGNETRNLTTTIRLARNYINGVSASNTIIGTSAITALLKEAAPVGWRRTKGSATLGFAYRYPLYPQVHVAICESEVQKNGAGGASPPDGATEATLAETVEDDPERGVQVITTIATTKGGTDPLGWVEQQQPTDATGETELSTGTENSARGEWRRLARKGTASGGKVTRIRKTYQLSGGTREGAAILMASPYAPTVTRGPWTPYRLLETVEVHALAVTSLEDIPIPEPLAAPWVLVEPVERGLPRVEQDANVPAMRLWRLDVTRSYLWPLDTDPLTDASLAGAILAPAGESL